MGNVLWKVNPTFVQDITTNPVQALGAPTQRVRSTEGEELNSGHRVIPATFPSQKSGTQVTLADFGLLLPANKTTVDYKLQGTPAFIAPERFHDYDPSPASDLWSFMAVFVYLYLGTMAFPNDTSMSGRDPWAYLDSIRKNLGPLPAEWATPNNNEALYA